MTSRRITVENVVRTKYFQITIDVLILNFRKHFSLRNYHYKFYCYNINNVSDIKNISDIYFIENIHNIRRKISS